MKRLIVASLALVTAGGLTQLTGPAAAPAAGAAGAAAAVGPVTPLADRPAPVRASRSRPVPLAVRPTARPTVRHTVRPTVRHTRPAPPKVRVRTTRAVTSQVAAAAHRSSGAGSWARSADGRRVARCESSDVGVHGVDVNSGVAYYGKWQMDRDFWLTYGGSASALGGGHFAPPETEQDAVAYRGFRARGWQPWACARIVGIL